MGRRGDVRMNEREEEDGRCTDGEDGEKERKISQ